MPGLTVKVVFQDIKKLETDALIVGFYENVRPLKGLAGELDWLLCGSLSNLVIKHNLRGSVGDVALLTSQGKVRAQKIFMVGLGRREDGTAASLTAAARTAVASAVSAGVKRAVMELFPVADMSSEASLPALMRGMAEGAGDGGIDISMLASDAAAYEKISRFVKG